MLFIQPDCFGVSFLSFVDMMELEGLCPTRLSPGNVSLKAKFTSDL